MLYTIQLILQTQYYTLIQCIPIQYITIQYSQCNKVSVPNAPNMYQYITLNQYLKCPISHSTFSLQYTLLSYLSFICFLLSNNNLIPCIDLLFPLDILLSSLVPEESIRGGEAAFLIDSEVAQLCNYTTDVRSKLSSSMKNLISTR